MNTVRSTPHLEFAIASAMTLVARMARAALARIRTAVASQVENSDGVGCDSSLPIFGRWSW